MTAALVRARVARLHTLGLLCCARQPLLSLACPPAQARLLLLLLGPRDHKQACACCLAEAPATLQEARAMTRAAALVGMDSAASKTSRATTREVSCQRA